MLTIADIAEAAVELGTLNAERSTATTAEEAARNTALESLFDGAEHLNSSYNRAAVHFAFVRGFATARKAA